MFVDDNPDASLDDILAHYGIRGMKWGIRKSKAETGVSRGQGAVVDRNNRRLRDFQSVKDAQPKGAPGSATAKTINTMNHLTMGRKLTTKYYDAHIHAMQAQNHRIQTGHMKIIDHLDAGLGVSPVARLISVAPKQ